MRRTIFDVAARRQLIDRLARLTPGSQRRFGIMTPSQMICHLQDSIRCATGEIRAEPRRTPMSNAVIRWLVIYVIPWPKGRAKTVREMLLTQPAEFNADRQTLAELIAQAAARGPQAEWRPHPAFGKMSGRDYGVLTHRHVDYHLRQFSV